MWLALLPLFFVAQEPARLPGSYAPPPSAGGFLTQGAEIVSEAEARAKGKAVVEAGFAVDVRSDGAGGFLVSEPKDARLNVAASRGWRVEATANGLRLRPERGTSAKGTLACTDARGTGVNYLKDGKGLMTVRLVPGRTLLLVLGKTKVATLTAKGAR